jgi:hypothetical protein
MISIFHSERHTYLRSRNCDGVKVPCSTDMYFENLGGEFRRNSTFVATGIINRQFGTLEECNVSREQG